MEDSAVTAGTRGVGWKTVQLRQRWNSGCQVEDSAVAAGTQGVREDCAVVASLELGVLGGGPCRALLGSHHQGWGDDSLKAWTTLAKACI